MGAGGGSRSLAGLSCLGGGGGGLNRGKKSRRRIEIFSRIELFGWWWRWLKQGKKEQEEDRDL